MIYINLSPIILDFHCSIYTYLKTSMRGYYWVIKAKNFHLQLTFKTQIQELNDSIEQILIPMKSSGICDEKSFRTLLAFF